MIIYALDKTLETLLKHQLPANLNGEDEHVVNIDFATPYRSYAPTTPTVNLFLYDVRENVQLRDNEWRSEWQIDPNEHDIPMVTTRRAPVRVDCSYLITTWAGHNADAHMLMGLVMEVLLRYPMIPEEFLHEDLNNQEVPLPTACLQPGHLQSLGEFWQAMGTEPRAVLNYTVTIGVDVFKEKITAPVVTERVFGQRKDGA